MTNITVLKDESLGGVEREYREVKRKAEVGERIKIVDADYDQFGANWGYDNGEVHMVVSSDGAQEVNIRPDGTIDSEIYVESNEYVTLEPTEIIRINSERFRMVDRKAALGERVIVISMLGGNSSNGRYYKTGDVAKVVHINLVGSGKLVADLTENAEYYGGGTWAIDRIDYRVLEPLTSAEPAPLLSDKPAIDQAAELIAKLTTRVASLEKRVAALETPKSRPATDEEVEDVLAKLSRAKSPQEIRDDIVKRAKEDVARLVDEDGFAHRLGNVCPTIVIEEFVVNRDKRTVVVLGFEAFGNRKKRALGIAKCAPGDVFNSHIGRAIALRRALGLAVPAEYLSAPSPTEINCGDIIAWTAYPKEYYTVGQREGSRVFIRNGTVYPDTYVNLTVGDHVYIADDSRESDSAEPRKEVA